MALKQMTAFVHVVSVVEFDEDRTTEEQAFKAVEDAVRTAVANTPPADLTRVEFDVVPDPYPPVVVPLVEVPPFVRR